MTNPKRGGERRGTPSAVASGESQAQSTSGEPEQQNSNPERVARRGGTGVESEVQFFDTTVVKVREDGVEVMSDHLAPGETLRRETTDRYTFNRPTETDARRAARQGNDDNK